MQRTSSGRISWRGTHRWTIPRDAYIGSGDRGPLIPADALVEARPRSRSRAGSTIAMIPDASITPDYDDTREVLHRLEGPAIIRDDGSREFYINGHKMTFEEFLLESPIAAQIARTLAREHASPDSQFASVDNAIIARVLRVLLE